MKSIDYSDTYMPGNNKLNTYRAVTGRRKHCRNLRFHVTTFFSDWAKNDQLRVLGKFREQLIKRAAMQ